MARARDYKAEYERRIASAAKRGLSRSQARGHARHGEAPVRGTKAEPDNARLEAALKALRRSGNQSAAAKEAQISPERLRRFLRENALAERAGRTWRITDRRHREMPVISNGEIAKRILLDFDQASVNGEYLNAVRAFVSSNDIDLLAPFVGRDVIDAKGVAHPLETNPNTLHRLAHASDEAFHEVYRLVL